MNAVDTNVLLYACDTRDAAKHSRAIALLRDTNIGIILWQVAMEFIAASRKLEGQGFRSADAWDRLSDLLVRFPLVHSSSAVLPLARRLHVDQNVAFWDAMILASCLDAGVSTLYSEDVPGSIISGLDVVNPFAAASA